MKTTMSEIKSTLGQSNHRLDSAEEKISELEAIAIEIIHNETHIEKKIFKKGQRISRLRDNLKGPYAYVIGVPGEWGVREWTEKHLQT